ncbi:MAG: Stp1/IreP family PP2C-type Ser/Thr phosphatase [Eubacteriales bacterium]
MIQIGFKTDTGKGRSVNEDAFFVMPKQNIYIIADGVGGQNAGDIASRTSVKIIAEYISKNPISKDFRTDEIKDYFAKCINLVNNEIFSLAKEKETQKGMATTLVILYVVGNKAHFINVGDSRAYLIRNMEIHQITEDHTVVNQLIKVGKITKKDAETHPMSNVITKAVGADCSIAPDYYSIDVKRKDIILLCSDGLYGEVKESEIMEICLNSPSMHQACNRLVQRANEYEGKDNITVICVRI